MGKWHEWWVEAECHSSSEWSKQKANINEDMELLIDMGLRGNKVTSLWRISFDGKFPRNSLNTQPIFVLDRVSIRMRTQINTLEKFSHVKRRRRMAIAAISSIDLGEARRKKTERRKTWEKQEKWNESNGHRQSDRTMYSLECLYDIRLCHFPSLFLSFLS